MFYLSQKFAIWNNNQNQATQHEFLESNANLSQKLSYLVLLFDIIIKPSTHSYLKNLKHLTAVSGVECGQCWPVAEAEIQNLALLFDIIKS